MSVLVWGSSVRAVRCDDCGAILDFGPCCFKRAQELRAVAAQEHSWACWDPTPDPTGQRVVAPGDRERDRCPKCLGVRYE